MMPSKINGLDTRPIQIGSGSPVKRVSDSTSGRSEAPESGTSEVHITDSARRLAALEQALTRQPEVDEARVRAVRTALEEGRYQASGERIADKLLTLEKALASPGMKDQEK